jgi:hypothetical protein
MAGRYLAVALRLKERHPATVRCTLQWVSPDLHGVPVTNEQIALDQAAGGWKYVALRSVSRQSCRDWAGRMLGALRLTLLLSNSGVGGAGLNATIVYSTPLTTLRVWL